MNALSVKKAGRMNKRLFPLISFILIGSFLLTNCGPVTSVPVVTPTVAVTPDIQVRADQVSPHVVAQDPSAGQRLELSSGIRIVFDRDMDQTKTEEAFTFVDADHKPVSGKVSWSGPKTFTFKPDSKLQPSAVYKATFSTAAAGADGKPLEDDLQLEFTTTDALAVGQVFPAYDAEEIDPKTNVTVIFNHPVVPLQIKEEQSSLPQPVTFTPEVAGQGEWVNSSVYVFQPEKPLLSGTRYSVRVEPGIKDTVGSTLEKSYVWQFTTRMAVVDHISLKNSWEAVGDRADNILLDQAFLVTFLQPMDPEGAQETIKVLDRETGQPSPIKLKWNQDFTVATIEPAGRYKIASFYDLVIPRETPAADGGPLKEGRTVQFSTVPLPHILQVSPAPNSQASEFQGELSIRFASPMRLASLKDKVRISPQPKQDLQWYFNDYSWELNIYGLEPTWCGSCRERLTSMAM
jgi:hypothetical protein